MKTITPMKSAALLFLTFVQGACGTSLSPTDISPAHPTQTVRVVEPPSPTPTFEGCGFQWAYEDLPELSEEFQRSIQALQPEAKARVYIFGEDCIHLDGSKTFLAMETDFDITLQVNDPTDDSALGDWIVKIMQVILEIPKERIVGPRPGLVRIVFQFGDQSRGVNFYVDQYQALPPGLGSAEIYRSLQTQQ